MTDSSRHDRKSKPISIAFLTLAACISFFNVGAAPGDLDPTFGSVGRVVLSTSGGYSGVRHFPDGDLLVFAAGSISIENPESAFV